MCKNGVTKFAFIATIYSKAKCDILWLGDDPKDEAKSAFNFVRDMASRKDHLPQDGKARVKALRAAASVIMKDDTLSKFQPILSDRPVWNRVWIVQEIVVAQRVLIHCGLRSIPWGSLTAFYMLALELPSFALGAIDGYTPLIRVMDSSLPAVNIDTARINHSNPDIDTSLLSLWKSFYKFEATDPRDRIYALLGLAKTTPLGLEADYTKQASEVFITAIRSAISQSRTPDALCLCRAVSDEARANMGLPTWVPDFGSTVFRDHLLQSEAPLYPASRKMSVGQDITILPALDISILILFGVQLDPISGANLAKGPYMTWIELGSRVRGLPRDIFECRYHTGESGSIAFARTLTGDRTFDGSATRQSEQETESLSRDIRSLLSWKGRLYSRLRNYLPSLVQCRILDAFERRERIRPKIASMVPFFIGYNFATTAKGFMATIPNISKEGDILCVLYGSRLPHVLRKVPGEEDTYTLVGTTYVHGFMYGEAIDWKDQGKLKEQKFKLI